MGFFTKRRIPAHALCAHFRGYFILRSTMEKKEPPVEHLIQHTPQPGLWYHPTLDLCIDASEARCTSDTRYIRRSCKPNAYTRDIRIRGKRAVGVFPLKDIATGAELTLPFDFDWTQATYNLECACRSSSECEIAKRGYKVFDPTAGFKFPCRPTAKQLARTPKQYQPMGGNNSSSSSSYNGNTPSNS